MQQKKKQEKINSLKALSHSNRHILESKLENLKNKEMQRPENGWINLSNYIS